MVFPQQQGGALSLACGPYPSTRSSPMNGTKLLRPRVIPFSCGLALALAVGCAGPAARQLAKPTPPPTPPPHHQPPPPPGTPPNRHPTAALPPPPPTHAQAA